MLDITEHNREEDLFQTGLLEQADPRECCLMHFICLFNFTFLYFMDMHFGIHLLEQAYEIYSKQVKQKFQCNCFA